jgi:hypothetical protein
MASPLARAQMSAAATSLIMFILLLIAGTVEVNHGSFL